MHMLCNKNLIHKLNYCVVVARYQEDVTWLKPLAPKLAIINKGNRETICKDLLPYTRTLRNIGTEEYAYLHYIVDHYEELPEIVLFTQGDITDHKDVHVPVGSQTWLTKKKYVGQYENAYTSTLKESDVLFDMLKQVYIYGCTQNALVWRYSDEIPDALYGLTFLNKFTKDHLIVPFGEWFKHNVLPEFPKETELTWFKNALFGVRKEFILTRPKEYYMLLIEEVEKHETHILHFERSWFYIFNCHAMHCGWEEFLRETCMKKNDAMTHWFPRYEPYKLHKFVNIYSLLKAYNVTEIRAIDVGGDSCECTHFVLSCYKKAKSSVLQKNTEDVTICRSLYGDACQQGLQENTMYNIVFIGSNIHASAGLLGKLKKVCAKVCFILFDGCTNIYVQNRLKLLEETGCIREITDVLFDDYMGVMHHAVYRLV